MAVDVDPCDLMPPEMLRNYHNVFIRQRDEDIANQNRAIIAAIIAANVAPVPAAAPVPAPVLAANVVPPNRPPGPPPGPPLGPLGPLRPLLRTRTRHRTLQM